MIPLQTQEQFESLLKTKANEDTVTSFAPAVIVYFTASWCGACQRLNLDALESEKWITWYKCDIDVNKYTLKYCGLQKIPSFIFIKSGKVLGSITSSDTDTILEMIDSSF
jgi:thiol-disulfide isomerase/thioredoxin